MTTMVDAHVPSVVADGATNSAHLKEIRAKLWQALRVTHLRKTNNAEDANAQDEHMVGEMPSDVHISPTTPVVPLELSRVDMEQLICCVFCAIHMNATADDAAAAAQSVMEQLYGSDSQTGAVVEAPYTESDVTAFLDSVPSRWLPDLVSAQEDAASFNTGDSLWEDYNLELIECIVSDEAPHRLLQPAEVLTLQRTTTAVELAAPLTDYFTVLPARLYPPVYDALFKKLCCCLEDCSAPGLSLAQFRLFFHWFYAIHFRNTNLARSNAAADNLYRRYQDARGDLTVMQFQLACEEVCAVYAQRRDAAAYLQQLVKRTERALSEKRGSTHEGQTATSSGADFFLHPERVTLPAWQRDLLDPAQLYLPDELRTVQQEAARYRRHTSPRIVLTGPSAIGKSAVGHELATTLHCVHLDVLELAMAALQNKGRSSVGDVVEACMQNQTPLPLTAQVALLREAMVSERARYCGYVFSDTIAAVNAADTADGIEEAFLRPLKVLEEARPNYVVELVCAVQEVYGEYAAARAGAVAAACGAALTATAADVEKRRQAAEKRQMKADCEKIRAHLVELESAGSNKEELEVARKQAKEAQEILDALDAEENDEDAEVAAAAAASAEGDALKDAEGEATQEGKAARENEELRLRLSALIYEGRRAAGVVTAPLTDDGVVAPLSAQDWTSSWRKIIEAAKSIGRYLSVDPIASSDSGHVVSYITHAFNLHPCDLAEALRASDDGVTGVEGVAAQGQPSSLAEDEERCRAMEEAVAARGLRPCPIFKRFCPVTAAVDGVLVEGAACYACAYRGTVYYFASPAKRDAFADNPTRYLCHTFPEQKAVLLLADDAAADTLAELLQQVADDVAIQCRLTPLSVWTYATLLEPRQRLLQSRAAAGEIRRKTEAAARKARLERQEQAIKAQSKKGKGKLEPSRPKAKRLSDPGGRNSSPQTSQPQFHNGSTGGGRRRVPRATVVERPQSMADEKRALIDAAKERRAEEVPLLVTALSTADLDLALFQRLAEQRLVPETVVTLKFIGAGMPAGTAADEQDGSEEDDGQGEGQSQENDEAARDTAVARRNANAPTSTSSSAFQRILKLLEKGGKADWRAAKAEAGEAGGSAAAVPSHTVFTIPVGETAVASEVVSEVLQQLNPLSIVASDDTVDETLGEAGENDDGDADDDEEQAEEDEALLYPEGTVRPPPVPPTPRDPLAKPMRRFLHQFGSRLDYCPVTLHDRGILVRGKQELCLRYVDGLYLFASEEARNAFARCPQHYVAELPPQDVPPRVWVVGVTQSGKKTMAAGLQEAYRVPFFVYDRQFFEECVEAALTPGGGMVRGVYIPADTKESNPYLKRAFALLESVHEKEKVEKKKLAEKAEAERLLAEHKRLVEEREAHEDATSADEEDAADDDWTEEREAELQKKLDFEPEDEEAKQVRLSESYLRIASCVTRFRPFDKLGYVMICPPFSDGDLDVLFDEGGIPEAVVRLSVDEEVFNQRSALLAAAQRATTLDAAATARAAAAHATQQAREAARAQRAREKALAKWRRRHIGADDVDVPSETDDDDAAAGQTNNADGAAAHDNEEAMSARGNRRSNEDAVVDRQAQEDALEEFMTFIEERRVEVVKINAAAAKETVRRAVVEALGRHLAYRASLFYHPEVLRPEEVEVRLSTGQCDWSSFGEQDPVLLYTSRHEGQRTACRWKPDGVRVGPELADDDNEERSGAGAGLDVAERAEDGQPAEEPEELSEVASDELEELRNAAKRRDQRARRAAARRVARVHNRLYSFDSDATLVRFMRNPWPFMQEPPPNPTLSQAPVVAVFEPDTRFETEVDGTKQRCLADSVAFNLDAKCVSTSSLLAWGAVHAHWQSLRLDCMLAAQQSVVDVSLTQRLLTLYLSSAEAKRDGVVLHNLPATAAMADALTRVSCAAPIVKVMTALSDNDDDAAAAQVAQSMREYASVDLSLPHPHVPLDSSNLVVAVHGVEAFRAVAQEARLREARAFPVALGASYEVFRHVQRHLSEFGAFCPYEWVEKGDLVRCFPAELSSHDASAMELSRAAKYLGQYFFFSSTEYLQRFLQNPTTVTDSAAVKPMPKQLPSPVPAADAAQLQETNLALEGCCPVLLYDTRDRRGMRGRRQPVAKKGSLDFVVDYRGQKYAMLSEEHQRRFLRRPWQYVEGAALPTVLRRPLPKGATPSTIADAEEYLQRQLYDPVAQALLAVGRERPIYPGLSAEESALKYVALYLKAHRDPDTVSAFEAASYKASFELFHQRATLYRQLVSPRAGSNAAAAVTPAAADANTDFCTFYEEARADVGHIDQLNRLPNPI